MPTNIDYEKIMNIRAELITSLLTKKQRDIEYDIVRRKTKKSKYATLLWGGLRNHLILKYKNLYHIPN